MGRIEFVFLMKFVNDVLAFIEPFSRAKEMVAENANIGKFNCITFRDFKTDES